MGNLHMFKNNVIEWVIAEDAEDAVRVWEEYCGEPYPEHENGEFVALDDNGTFTILYHDKVDVTDIPEGAAVEDDAWGRLYCEAKVTDWIALRGREFFASTEV